ncbi:MAG TPA: hypothetical protein DDX71_04490 [Ruminococcus sp.]|nr:hypothetical protein [Ruminococcus sp.]
MGLEHTTGCKQIRLVIGCDADGVLTDLAAHNLRAGKAAFAREAVNPDAYALDEMFDVSDLPKLKKYGKAFGIYRRYCKSEPARAGAAAVIAGLAQQGCEFHAVTARKFATDHNPLGKMARHWFEAWLQAAGIRFRAIHYCREDLSPQDKLFACRKLGADAMIEDRADNALMLAENGFRVLMPDAPYNRDTAHENITRVKSWAEIQTALLSLDVPPQKPFQKLSREAAAQLSSAEKAAYFRAYQRHLQAVRLDEAAFRKGDRRFRALYRMIRLPAKLFYHVTAFGKENVPYQDGFIIACNHCDSADQYRLGLALGNRPFVGFAAKEIEHTFRGWLFSYTGLGVFIDRKDPADKQQASEKLASYVAHNRTALIFPEGTRKNKSPEGKKRFLNRFQPGTAALAQKTGTGILPAAVSSFGRTVYVRFGEMIYVSGTDSVIQKTRALERAVAALSMENLTQYYETVRHDSAALASEKQKYQAYLNEISHEEDDGQ